MYIVTCCRCFLLFLLRERCGTGSVQRVGDMRELRRHRNLSVCFSLSLPFADSEESSLGFDDNLAEAVLLCQSDRALEVLAGALSAPEYGLALSNVVVIVGQQNRGEDDRPQRLR